MQLKPPPLDPLYPIHGTRAALAEWAEHQRLCVIAMFLEVVSLNAAPRSPRHPALPSSVLADETRVEVERSVRAGIEGATLVGTAMSDERRLGTALRRYQRDRGDLTTVLMVCAMLAGCLVHIAFVSATLGIAMSEGDAAAFVVLACWAGCAFVSGWACRRWVGPLVYP